MAAQLKLIEGGEEQVGESTSNPVQTVFEFWRVLMEKPRAQLGEVRRKKIAAALRIGYSVDDLRLAIVGCKYDNWSQGENENHRKYDDLELICRDEVRIDRFVELGDEYMKRTARREQERAEAEKPGTAMPADVRARLDALFGKFLKKGKDNADRSG